MASTGYLITILNRLPEDIRKPMVAFVNEAFGQLRFGAPDAEAPKACENMGGHLIPLTTNSVSNEEVAVAHRLGRVPRVMWPVLDPNTQNATLPETLTVSRAADSEYLYVKSPTISAFTHLYVE